MTATLPAGATPANFDLFSFAHDFVLDGVPMVFARYNGHLLPALGAEVITSHGIGYVERITGDRSVIVRIVDFEETPVTLHKGGNKSQPYEVAREDYVARLSDLYNNRLYLEATWLLQRALNSQTWRWSSAALVGSVVARFRFSPGSSARLKSSFSFWPRKSMNFQGHSMQPACNWNAPMKIRG